MSFCGAGVLVGYENPPSCRVFPWRDISNVINHKRHFLIECQSEEDNVQLEFTDPESAKYVWKLCVLQVPTVLSNYNKTWTYSPPRPQVPKTPLKMKSACILQK